MNAFHLVMISLFLIWTIIEIEILSSQIIWS
jgi:hypothetical protein